MSVTVSSILEGILYKVKDQVKGELSSYLSAMITLKADSVLLEDIKEHVVGDLNALKKNRYPMAFYYPMSIDVEQADLGSDEIRMQVFVSLSLKGSDSDNLVIRALRYSDCLRELVNDDRTMGGACDEARVVKVNYFSSEPGGENIMEIETILSIIVAVAY